MADYVEKKYAALDQAILAAIGYGKKQYMILCIDSVVSAHADEYATTKSPSHRVIDRRLQSLRKRGVLKYTRASNWSRT